jgi:hypothetical protein
MVYLILTSHCVDIVTYTVKVDIDRIKDDDIVERAA